MPLSVITKEGETFVIDSPETFAQVLGVRYLKNAVYEDPSVQEWVKWRFNYAEKKGWITARQKWLGHYYADGIEGASRLDLTIRWIDDTLEYGLFTNRPIAAHTYVGEYAGMIRRRRWWRRWLNYYCFDYTIGENHRSPYVIDAQDAGNHTRFINHSTEGNVKLASVAHHGRVCVLLYAGQEIGEGEQLSYDYGQEYWSQRPPPVQLVAGATVST